MRTPLVGLIVWSWVLFHLQFCTTDSLPDRCIGNFLNCAKITFCELWLVGRVLVNSVIFHHSKKSLDQYKLDKLGIFTVVSECLKYAI